jgi:hypothetical protein
MIVSSLRCVLGIVRTWRNHARADAVEEKERGRDYALITRVVPRKSDGALCRNRTGDLILTMEALYLLS